MKQLLSLFIAFFCLVPNTQAQSDSITNLLIKLNLKTITASEKKELKIMALGLQNRGQFLDERNHDYKGALMLTDSAVSLFNSLKDTLNEANNRKFRGYLLGRFKRYEEGKGEIQKAIQLFQLKNAMWGVAVSQFDLSLLYEFENKLDSAIYYCNTSILYWKTEGNSDRVFLNQSMLIHLLIKSNDLIKAKMIQNDSRKISENTKQHYQGLLNFYIVSENLYKATKEFDSADSYRNFYARLITELGSTGIAARSYFDEK